MVDGEGGPRPGCDDCNVRVPPLYDVHIVDDRVASEILSGLSKTAGEINPYSMERFQREIDKCILCFACRQACFGCYCKTCFAERGTPNWLPAEIDRGAKMAFHLGKAMHLAGRCVECGACEAACASGVELLYISKELSKFIEENYDYKAGMDPDASPPMSAFMEDDREIGFLEKAGG